MTILVGLDPAARIVRPMEHRRVALLPRGGRFFVVGAEETLEPAHDAGCTRTTLQSRLPAHSSSGLGRRPLTAVARVRIPYAPPSGLAPSGACTDRHGRPDPHARHGRGVALGEWWLDAKTNEPLKSGPRRLSQLLRPYGIQPVRVRIGTVTQRGYRREDFLDVWERFAAPPRGDATSATSATREPHNQADVADVADTREGGEEPAA
jgi:hypothetical protein